MTDLNEMLWASIPAISYTKGMYRRNKKAENQLATPRELFKASGDDVRRLAHDLERWHGFINEFENWNRLNSLVALLSSLEVYLSSVVSLALESNPGLLLNASKAVDGVHILKIKNENHQFFRNTEKVTKGTWTERTNEFYKIFSSIPTLLASNIGELDHMRILRNKVAHAFGRDIEKARCRNSTILENAERLSLKRLQKWLKLIFEIVKELDTYLLTNHIGEYEMIYLYHTNKSFINSKGIGYFKSLINQQNFCQMRSKTFCKELIEYYKKL
jgi:hypothetical protein